MNLLKRGAKGAAVLLTVTFALNLYAQNENKFKMYGFADMTISKYFPKDNSWIRSIDQIDEKTYFNLDHFNLYTSFQPNSKLRLLAELSFQDKPVNFVNSSGMKMHTMTSDSIWSVPVQAEKNKVKKGIYNYEWGSFSVERMMFSVNLNRFFNLSFGKFITPAGIWNVDHGSPVIMTVNQPSQYSHGEIFPKSQLGIMEEGKVFIGDADLSYSVYLSSGRENQALYKPEDISVGGQLRLSLPGLDEINLGFSGYTGKVNSKIRWTIMSMTTTDFVHWKTTTEIEDEDLIVYRENIIGGDVRLSKWGATLQAELNYQNLTNFLADDAKSKTLATYVIGSYDVLKKENVRITPYAYYEFVKYDDPLNDPTKNPVAVTDGYKKFMGGVNFRFFTNYGVKLEYNWTRIEMGDDPDGFNDCPGISSQFYIAF